MADRVRTIEYGSNPDRCYRSVKKYLNGSCSASPSYSTTSVYYDSMENMYNFSKEMVDREIPDFHKRSKMGEVFFNPLSSIVEETNQTLFNRSGTHVNERWGCTPGRWYEVNRYETEGNEDVFSLCDDLGFTVTPTVPDVGTLDNRAISKAWANLDQAEVLALVSIAEAEKTLGTVKNVLRRSLSIIFGARKRALRYFAQAIRNPKKRKAILEDISNLYLEARYGLRPLAYEIAGTIAIANGKERPRRLTTRGFYESSGSDSGFDTTPYTWGLMTGETRHEWNEIWSVSSRAGCLAEVKLDRLNDWGLTSIASSAWELVPFSFIVGWFLNISDVIGSWEPKVNTNVLGSWVVTTIVASRSGSLERTIINGTSGSYRDRFIPAGSLTGNYSKCVTTRVRTPHPSRPIIPSWNLRLDPLKLLDLALIAKTFRKEKRELNKFLR